jgi:hypothetical protein
VRELFMHDQNDPNSAYVLAVFESQEKAREREQDPRRAEGQRAIQELMAKVLTAPPEFTDLTVTEDWVRSRRFEGAGSSREPAQPRTAETVLAQVGMTSFPADVECGDVQRPASRTAGLWCRRRLGRSVKSIPHRGSLQR